MMKRTVYEQNMKNKMTDCCSARSFIQSFIQLITVAVTPSPPHSYWESDKIYKQEHTRSVTGAMAESGSKAEQNLQTHQEMR